MRSIVALSMMLGCGGPRSKKVSTEISVDDYSMLKETTISLTFRDDGETETSPSNATLLRGRNTGNGILDLRRGSRWADGETVGSVAFAQTDRIRIVAWELGDSSGEGEFPLAMNMTKEGEEVSKGGWNCTVEQPDLIETYYGDFTDVLTFACTGDEGPAGDWHFAKGVGLVAYVGDSYQLDLVSPW